MLSKIIKPDDNAAKVVSDFRGQEFTELFTHKKSLKYILVTLEKISVEQCRGNLMKYDYITYSVVLKLTPVIKVPEKV